MAKKPFFDITSRKRIEFIYWMVQHNRLETWFNWQNFEELKNEKDAKTQQIPHSAEVRSQR